ncbi:MAG: hypothetical protein HZB41_00435 [Ignavibacteriae bacterium]|nr:hypothetical protein [Ignavibacteriota bacterium]
MRRLYKPILVLIFIFSLQISSAQGPKGKSFGFGIMFGDPTGATLKFWTSQENAFVVDVGSSYFGSLRFNGDYLWHFDAFNSQIVKLYAGPGAVVGIGEGHSYWYKEDHEKFYFRKRGDVGIGARGMFGINIIPRRTPLEIFLEFGVLIGIVPDFGTSVDAGVGIRFYP